MQRKDDVRMDEMLTFLARAPTLGDIPLKWGQAGPRPGTGGVYLRGVKLLQSRTNLLGQQKQRCRAEFMLRLCLPLPEGDTDTALANARRLTGLQAWVAAESAAGRAPRLGNCEPITEQMYTDGGQLDRADTGGTGMYSIRVIGEYTMEY